MSIRQKYNDTLCPGDHRFCTAVDLHVSVPAMLLQEPCRLPAVLCTGTLSSGHSVVVDMLCALYPCAQHSSTGCLETWLVELRPTFQFYSPEFR